MYFSNDNLHQKWWLSVRSELIFVTCLPLLLVRATGVMGREKKAKAPRWAWRDAGYTEGDFVFYLVWKKPFPKWNEMSSGSASAVHLLLHPCKKGIDGGHTDVAHCQWNPLTLRRGSGKVGLIDSVLGDHALMEMHILCLSEMHVQKRMLSNSFRQMGSCLWGETARQARGLEMSLLDQRCTV